MVLLTIWFQINNKVHSWRNGFSKDAISAVLDHLEKDLRMKKEKYAEFSTFMVSDRKLFVFEKYDEGGSVSGLASPQFRVFFCVNVITDLFVGDEGRIPR